MKIFRSILIVFSFFIFGIGSLFLNLILFPIEKKVLNNEIKYKEFASNIIQRLWLFFLKFIIFIRLIDIKTDDIEKLKSIKNKIIVSTHPSFIDIVILIALIPKSTCYVKSSLAKNKIINRLVNSIFVSNDLSLDEMQVETQKMIELGFNVIIFPMGIRHRKNEFPKIKKGASLIATKTNKNIIPIQLFANGDFLFINQPFYECGSKTVTFSLKVCKEIKINEFYNDSEIIYKQNVTKEIEKRLYNNICDSIKSEE